MVEKGIALLSLGIFVSLSLNLHGLEGYGWLDFSSDILMVAAGICAGILLEDE